MNNNYWNLEETNPGYASFTNELQLSRGDMDAIVILKKLRQDLAGIETRCHTCGERSAWRILFDAGEHLSGNHSYTVSGGAQIGCGPEEHRLRALRGVVSAKYYARLKKIFWKESGETFR
jgi:hypothetical protein